MNRAFDTSRVHVFYASSPRFDAAPAGLPDWDDTPKTSQDSAPFALEDTGAMSVGAPSTVRGYGHVPEGAPPPAVEKSPSHVRVRNPNDSVTSEMPTQEWSEACAFIDTMGELQLNFQVNLLCLENTLEQMSYDRSANAAADTLRTRIQELTDVRDALNDIYLDAAEPAFAPLFGAEAPLTAYIKGVYLWCNEVTGALTELSNALRVLQPDWFELRQRIDRAGMWYFDGLPREIRPELERHQVRADFAEEIEQLFFAAIYLAQGLDKKFG
jgi:hypothetical protein